MTEADWLVCTRPYPMLNYLEDRGSNRKLMLFSVACLRRIWHLLTDDRSRRMVEAAEQFADNPGSEEVRRAGEATCNAFHTAYEAGEIQDGADGNTHEAVQDVIGSGTGCAMAVANKAAESIGSLAAGALRSASAGEWSEACSAAWQSAESTERAAQAELLRDIVGNLYHPPTLNPTWRTPRVVSLARAIYDERAFERIPILADALEEAGCVEAVFLDHCRRAGEHARGCWVVDLLLGQDDGMTEAEWLACTDLQLMWWHLRPKPSRRKQQLFAAACCHRLEHLLIDERLRRAIEVLERLADGHAMEDEWHDAGRTVAQVARREGIPERRDNAASTVATADCTYGPTVPAAHAAEALGRPDEPSVQAALLRDVLGNPFRPVTIDTSWRAPAVVELANSIYRERAFDRLPALADVLERAGCKDAEVLGHCRGPGPHTRGCWVVDLVLGTPPAPAGPRGNAMTLAEWEASTDADRMLYCIGLTVSKRKLRLFACACCRRVWTYMKDQRSHKGIEIAEQYADGLVGAGELESAREGTAGAWNAGPDWDLYMATRAAHFACLDDEQSCLRARDEARGVVRWSATVDPAARAVEEERTARYLNREGPVYYAPQREEAVRLEVAAQAHLLRDIFGNSFRDASVDPACRTPSVMQLARAVYDERTLPEGTLDPARLAILADALEEAACDNTDILSHLRGPGPHVRGCWALDLILGNE